MVLWHKREKTDKSLDNKQQQLSIYGKMSPANIGIYMILWDFNQLNGNLWGFNQQTHGFHMV
jgi:hypothetical protein